MVILNQEFRPPITFPLCVADELQAYQIAAGVQARMLNAPLIEMAEGEHYITPQEYPGLLLVTVRRDPQLQEIIGIVKAFSRPKTSIEKTRKDETLIPSGETVLSPTSGCTCMNIESGDKGTIHRRIFYADEKNLATDFPYPLKVIRTER